MRLNALAMACLMAVASLSFAQAAKVAPPPQVEDAVVLYRGKSYPFKNQDALKIAHACFPLLETACEEVSMENDADEQARYDRALSRSCITIKLAKPMLVPKAGNNVVPVRVEALIVPFSPDLDPESVYVLPGKPARRFTQFIPSLCDDLRRMLCHGGIYQPAVGAVVKGLVRLEGDVPAARRWKVDAEIERAFGLTHYVEETWQVGAGKGLRSCVISLRAKDPGLRLAPRPMLPAVIDRDMVRYEPRVTVLTPGTELTLRNTDSPCRGYELRGSKPQADNGFSYLVKEGTQQTVTLRGPDVCSINCPMRPYARAYIHVVDTPYFAISDSNGQFTIQGVPEGDYEVTAWHEAAGRLKPESGSAFLTLKDGKSASVSFVARRP